METDAVASQVDPKEIEGWTPIVIKGPLPMDVATTLMMLIGSAYPGAVIDGSGKHVDQRFGFDREHWFVFLVDPKERREVTDEEVGASKAFADDHEALGFTASAGQANFLARPARELSHFLGAVAHKIFTEEGGVNYVEWEVRTKDEEPERRYLLTVALRKDGEIKTPHALRMEAEERIAELENDRLDGWAEAHDLLCDEGPNCKTHVNPYDQEK